MATIYGFGLAPKAVEDGYMKNIAKLISGTEEEVLKKYQNEDVALVRGVGSEYAVLKRKN